jgi:hypothetical protein
MPIASSPQNSFVHTDKPIEIKSNQGEICTSYGSYWGIESPESRLPETPKSMKEVASYGSFWGLDQL